MVRSRDALLSSDIRDMEDGVNRMQRRGSLMGKSGSKENETTDEEIDEENNDPIIELS